MKLDAERGVFVIGPHELPVKFSIVEGYEYPSEVFGRVLRTETRVVRCQFENRWSISIIWGSMTYSDNYDHPHGHRAFCIGQRHEGERVYPDFIEEPQLVEIAVMTPEPRVIPARTFELPSRTVEMPEHDTEIWGDVIGYVDAESLWSVVNTVKTFDSDGMAPPEDGPYLESLEPDGPRFLVWTHTEVTSG